ncbi:MAG: 30S ribosomal protein S17, partial [Caldilineaceae bacterium]|nr:30S ribosomal protein S17 [Caldilineaceae bacterium]
MRERRKVLSGTVVQDSMDKTVSVRVERTKRHPLYGKIIRTYKRYQVHDEGNQARIGDSVRLRQCRPAPRRR